jgi:hypothetical protein
MRGRWHGSTWGDSDFQWLSKGAKAEGATGVGNGRSKRQQVFSAVESHTYSPDVERNVADIAQGT